MSKLIVPTGKKTFMQVSPNELKYLGDGQFRVIPYSTQILYWNDVLQKSIYGIKNENT